MANITPGPYVTRKRKINEGRKEARRGGKRKRDRIQLARGKSIEVTKATAETLPESF